MTVEVVSSSAALRSSVSKERLGENRKLVLEDSGKQERYLPASLSDLDPDMLRQALQSQEQHIQAMGQELDRLKGEILRREERSNALHQQLLQALAERDQKLQELAAVRAQLDSVLSSTSWRATAAMRRIFQRSPRAARLARRLIKVAWLTVTLRLPARIRQYAVAAKAQRLASK